MSGHLLAFAEAVASDAAVTVTVTLRGEGAGEIGALVRDAVMMAFGCTCWHPGDPAGVYAEDALCQLHRPLYQTKEPKDGTDKKRPHAEPGQA